MKHPAVRRKLQRLAGVFLSAALCIPAGALAESEEAYWDFDKDGACDRSDASLLLASIASDAADPSADCTGDGCVTAADAARLLRFVLGEAASLQDRGSAADEELVSAARRLASRAFQTVDMAALSGALAGQDATVYGTLAQNRQLFLGLADDLNSASDRAAESAASLLERETGADAQASYPKRRLSWKQAAALYLAFGESLPAILSDTLVINLTRTGASASLALEFPLHDEILASGTREQLMTGKFAYAYLNTVYDEGGEIQPYTAYPLSEAYLATLAHPLNDGAKQFTIKDGWYDPRSKNTRMHTGTDILAPARTPIRSVTEGVVQYIGYMAIPGNYVIVLDPYGFEYHYYHMVELSKAVQEGDIVHQGDVIGLVGNTGNSAANHLHLTILSPDYTYINPYDVFRDAGIGPIRENGAQ